MLAPPSFLQSILAAKRQEVARLRQRHSMLGLRRQAAQVPPVRDLAAALTSRPGPALIAEIKRRSPAAGPLRPEADAAELACQYQAAGAAAISVLTDHTHFGGSWDDLARVRRAVDLPVLAKDFFLHPAQIYRARAAGADAVLLIVAALTPSRLEALYACAREIGLAALVEVHTPAELAQALELNPSLIAINNRNLHTMQVDLTISLRLRPLVPPHITVVAASGLQKPEQLRTLYAGGLRAFLVGSALMRAPQPAQALAALKEAV
jgi:indole-3-glycerol phosphate synthase